ncbi:hypothetical protein FNV43_RR20168 [Rhamnella rubrinervis]|uniref:DOCKER Lobe B domain-containing protein n=1 Tax=Rhamnella rubrinervis TaxID=2594499 RepID=A0A8K0E0Z5_9ROSA|nr:hypothetical protein FNV43_RR20168 [Rhamnella rubrinervis]
MILYETQGTDSTSDNDIQSLMILHAFASDASSRLRTICKITTRTSRFSTALRLSKPVFRLKSVNQHHLLRFIQTYFGCYTWSKLVPEDINSQAKKLLPLYKADVHRVEKIYQSSFRKQYIRVVESFSCCLREHLKVVICGRVNSLLRSPRQPYSFREALAHTQPSRIGASAQALGGSFHPLLRQKLELYEENLSDYVKFVLLLYADSKVESHADYFIVTLHLTLILLHESGTLPIYLSSFAPVHPFKVDVAILHFRPHERQCPECPECCCCGWGCKAGPCGQNDGVCTKDHMTSLRKICTMVSSEITSEASATEVEGYDASKLTVECAVNFPKLVNKHFLQAELFHFCASILELVIPDGWKLHSLHIISDSRKVKADELQPGVCYLQITAVDPLEDEDLGNRRERIFSFSAESVRARLFDCFLFDTPVTKNGKTQGGLKTSGRVVNATGMIEARTAALQNGLEHKLHVPIDQPVNYKHLILVSTGGVLEDAKTLADQKISAVLDFSLSPPSWDETLTDDEQAHMVILLGADSAELNFSLCSASCDEPIT